MISPYRDATTPDNDADEPMPQFRPKTYDVAYLVGRTALTLGLAWLCRRSGDEAGATTLLVLWPPELVVCVAALVFEHRVRAWLGRRHARMVLRGVAELEAQIAHFGDPR
jgi:hypothetical protein